MRVGEPVDALVSYRANRAFPILKAILWHGRRVGFETLGDVERSDGSLLYQFDQGFTRFRVRLELARHAWYLESIEDSSITDFPPPRVFAPTDWH